VPLVPAVTPVGPRPRYRWTVLAVGTTAQAAYSAVYLGVAVLAPPLRDKYGLSLAEVGVVIASPGIGAMLTLLPWGLLVDRIGERIVSALGLGLAAAALAGAAVASDAAALVTMLALAGAAGASVNSATGRAVMTWFDRTERGFALGVRQTAIPLGGVLAGLGLPQVVHTGGVRAAFFLLAAGCLTTALVALVGLRTPSEIPEDPDAPERADPLRDRRIWLLSAGSALLTCAQSSIVGFTVLYLHSEKGFTTGEAGVVLAAMQVLGVAGRIGAGRWSDRRGERMWPLRAIAVVLAAAVAVTAALAGASAGAVVPALVVAGGLAMSWNGLSFTAVAELAGRSRSGAALGFQQSVIAAANSVTPPAFAAVASGASWQFAFAAVVACPVAGLVVFRSVDLSVRPAEAPDPA
jgi:sugar phosphate permease